MPKKRKKARKKIKSKIIRRRDPVSGRFVKKEKGKKYKKEIYIKDDLSKKYIKQEPEIYRREHYKKAKTIHHVYKVFSISEKIIQSKINKHKNPAYIFFRIYTTKQVYQTDTLDVTDLEFQFEAIDTIESQYSVEKVLYYEIIIVQLV